MAQRIIKCFTSLKNEPLKPESQRAPSSTGITDLLSEFNVTDKSSHQPKSGT